MLEVLRDYAQERFQLDPERDSVAARHHAYFAEMAIAGSGDRQAERFSRLAAEQENVRAMLGGSGPAVERLRAAVRLRQFWLIRGENREGREWLERLAAEATDAARSPAAARGQPRFRLATPTARRARPGETIAPRLSAPLSSNHAPPRPVHSRQPAPRQMTSQGSAHGRFSRALAQVRRLGDGGEVR